MSMKCTLALFFFFFGGGGGAGFNPNMSTVFQI